MGPYLIYGKKGYLYFPPRESPGSLSNVRDCLFAKITHKNKSLINLIKKKWKARDSVNNTIKADI